MLEGRRGGYAFIEDLHRSIINQLANQNLPPIVDPLMIRMILRQGEYGNLQYSNVNREQMEEFCLGMRTHTSSMPVEEIPNDRFDDTPSALLCESLEIC